LFAETKPRRWSYSTLQSLLAANTTPGAALPRRAYVSSRLIWFPYRASDFITETSLVFRTLKKNESLAYKPGKIH